MAVISSAKVEKGVKSTSFCVRCGVLFSVTSLSSAQSWSCDRPAVPVDTLAMYRKQAPPSQPRLGSATPSCGAHISNSCVPLFGLE